MADIIFTVVSIVSLFVFFGGKKKPVRLEEDFAEREFEIVDGLLYLKRYPKEHISVDEIEKITVFPRLSLYEYHFYPCLHLRIERKDGTKIKLLYPEYLSFADQYPPRKVIKNMEDTRRFFENSGLHTEVMEYDVLTFWRVIFIWVTILVAASFIFLEELPF